MNSQKPAETTRIFTSVVLITVISLSVTLADLTLLLEFRPADILLQPWRLLSSTIVHLDLQHAFANCLSLLLICFFWKHIMRLKVFITALFVLTLTSNALLLLLPYNVNYAGMSGVLHGLVVLLIGIEFMSGRKHWLSWFILGLTLAKVAAELSGWRPDYFQGPYVAEIHAAGVIAAFVLLPAYTLVTRLRKKA